MKKYLSIIDAAVNSTFSVILRTLLALSAAELLYFLLRLLLQHPQTVDLAGTLVNPFFLDLISGPIIPLLAAAAFVVISLSLTHIHGGKKTRTWYTIRRLSIPEKDFYLTLIGYTFLVYLLLILVQILLYMAMFLIFRTAVGAKACGSADLFLVFVMNSFACRLLPLSRPLWFLAEAALLLAGSSLLTQVTMTTAHSDTYHPDFVFTLWIIALLSLPVLFFMTMGENNLWIICLIFDCLLITAVSIHTICTFRRKDLQ